MSNNVTATEMASTMYEQAKNIASGKIDLEVSYSTIFATIILAVVHTIISVVGTQTFATCREMKGKKLQENLNKYLLITIAIAFTIPFTLLMNKFVTDETGAFMIFYGIMGTVASSAVLNWSLKCKDAKTRVKIHSGVSLAVFLVALIGGIIMSRPKKIISNI